jgi:hypothetical protein
MVMTRILKFMLLLLLLAACDDNGTVLGSMPSGGAPNAGAGGGAAGDQDVSSARAEVSGGGSSSGGGGSAGSPPAADGGMNAGEGGTGGDGSGGSSAGMSTGGSSCTVGGDCKSRVQNYQARLAEARLCTPTQAPECSYTVVDICGCMVSVQSLDAPATQCYLEALEDARECHNCTPEPCPVPVGTCSGSSTGICL